MVLHIIYAYLFNYNKDWYEIDAIAQLDIFIRTNNYIRTLQEIYEILIYILNQNAINACI